VPSFLSEPGPGPYRTGRAGLRPGPNNGLRAGLAGLMLIGHLYIEDNFFPLFVKIYIGLVWFRVTKV
jgi:hypothetical protein